MEEGQLQHQLVTLVGNKTKGASKVNTGLQNKFAYTQHALTEMQGSNSCDDVS